MIWSIGNEIHDTPYPLVAKSIVERLMKIFHAEDPTRPVTMALFRPNTTGDYNNGLADMLDVVGQNYRENELTKARLARQMPAVGTGTVVCTQANVAFTVAVSTTQTLNPNFRRVDVRVRDAADAQILQVSTVVGRY